LVCAALTIVTGVATASPPQRFTREPAPERVERFVAFENSTTAAQPSSHSIGFPWQGRLEEGVLLRPSETMRYISARPPERHFYGTAELVGLLTDGAAHVARTVPGSAQLTVGDLSAREGGDIPSHRSHENGRDVDLGFYMVDADGRPWTSQRYLNVLADGRVSGAPAGVRFDDARNWRLIESFLTNESRASVQYVFVSRAVKARLMAEAQRVGASAEVIAKFDTVVLQPRTGSPLRDHFHMRIYCPGDDSPQCTDVAPYWPSLADFGAGTDVLARIGRAVNPGI
jgi:penicillin-insensitive murein endopeptidase